MEDPRIMGPQEATAVKKKALRNILISVALLVVGAVGWKGYYMYYSPQAGATVLAPESAGVVLLPTPTPQVQVVTQPQAVPGTTGATVITPRQPVAPIDGVGGVSVGVTNQPVPLPGAVAQPQVVQPQVITPTAPQAVPQQPVQVNAQAPFKFNPDGSLSIYVAVLQVQGVGYHPVIPKSFRLSLLVDTRHLMNAQGVQVKDIPGRTVGSVCKVQNISFLRYAVDSKTGIPKRPLPNPQAEPWYVGFVLIPVDSKGRDMVIIQGGERVVPAYPFVGALTHNTTVTSSCDSAVRALGKTVTIAGVR